MEEDKATSKEESQEEPVTLNIDELFKSFSDIVFSNLKVYLEDRLKQFDPYLESLDDIKLNIATLSSVISSKGFFTQEEFRECFYEMRRSFGIVNNDGTMEGKIIVTQYNFA